MNRRLMVVAMVLVGTACGANTPRAWFAQLVPPDADHFARGVIDSLRERPPQATLGLLTKEVAATPLILDSLGTVQRFIPPGPIDSILLVGANVFTQAGTTRRDVTYQLRAGRKWVVVELVFDETLLEGRRVRYLHVQPISESVQSLNALSLRRASPSALFAVLLSVLVIACALYAAVQVVRSPLERRWLWVIVALLGFGKFSVEWHTGAITDQWFAVQLLGTSLVREGFYGRWWVSVSLPGGAFIALERRRRALAAKARAIALAVPPKPSHDVA